MSRIHGVTIDYETADRITAATLAEYRDNLQSDINNHLEKGTWLHPEDLAHNTKVIAAIDVVLKDFTVC